MTCYVKIPKGVKFFVIFDSNQKGSTIYRDRPKDPSYPYSNIDLRWINFLFSESGNPLLFDEKRRKSIKGNRGYTLFWDNESKTRLVLLKDEEIIKEGSFGGIVNFLLRGKLIRSLGIDYRVRIFKTEEEFEESKRYFNKFFHL